MNSLDYGYTPEFNVPKDVTLGFSYVWNRRSHFKTLRKIREYTKFYGASYVRVVPDCLSAKRIDECRKTVAPHVSKLGEKFFFTMKGYSKPEECWIGYLRPFLNADGYIYRCSANPLIKRKFHRKFRMCHMHQLECWKTPEPFATGLCGLCFFKPQNDLLAALMSNVRHKDFI